MFLPGVNTPQGPAQRTICKNNTRKLGLGILNYESDHGTLPPAFTVDAAGNRLHSWRTLILPYIEEPALYESIDLSKPWDDPVNAQASASMPDVFLCPSSKIPSRQTTYLAVVVPGGCFGSDTPRTLAEFTDDTSQTLMLMEVGQEQAIHWMSPNDVDEKIIASMGSQTKLAHPRAFHAMTVDGACHLVPSDTSPATLSKLISVAGKDPVDTLNF